MHNCILKERDFHRFIAQRTTARAVKPYPYLLINRIANALLYRKLYSRVPDDNRVADGGGSETMSITKT